VFPVLSYENDYVRLAGTAIDLKLGSVESLNFAFRTKFALGDGYQPGDAPILNGMATRRGSLWAGPAVVWTADFSKISLEVLADALRKSKSIEGKLGIERNLRAGPVVFTPHAAADFFDKKYVDYYYGVTTGQATSNRPAYEGRSTVNFEAGLRTAYMFDRTNSMFLDFNATALGKGITDSPLVDKKLAPSVVVGNMYRF
jgi:outer membrane scaffolding protein for murein synthesis (MipA/OmpV family)